MNIPVVFCSWGNEKSVASSLGDCYILSGDNWDDFGYRTYFNVYIYKDGEEYGKFGRKILFENQDVLGSSSSFLENLNNSTYLDMKEVYENYNFISLGYEYNELKKIFREREVFDEILKTLNDVIYLEKNEPNNPLLDLKQHDGFETSLCRDQSSKKLLDEGLSILYDTALDLDRLKFNFSFDLNNRNYDYSFNFVKENLPSRINILIGKNGSGKSQTLLSLSTYFINPNESAEKFNSQVDVHPNFISNLMVFAYNIYEDFYVNKENEKLNIDYKYLGLKKVNSFKDIEFKDFISIENGFYIINFLYNQNDNLEKELLSLHKENKINTLIESTYENLQIHSISKDSIIKVIEKLLENLFNTSMDVESPIQSTFNSFKEIYIKDRNNYSHSIQLNDVSFRNKVFEFINNAINFTLIGLKLISNNRDTYISRGFDFNNNYLILKEEQNTQNLIREIDFNDFEEKLYFFNDEIQLHLSSGQQTFIDLVINLLSLIKNNTLVLVDEPENTLHPNLEIDYIKILNSILEEFDSFAIIATHSPTIVREVPTNYVNIIKVNEQTNEVHISNPNIGTFGGDIGTISNYVFDDILKDKKVHEEWFKKEQEKYINFSEFEEKYKGILNYDFLLYCKNNWTNRWDF